MKFKFKNIIFSTVLCCCLLFLSSCRSNRSQDDFFTDSNTCKILSTHRMIHDLVVKIVGDDAEALVLIDGPLDPHSYELVKGDGDKINRADLIFANGLGLEHSFSFRKALESHSDTLFLGDLIRKKEPSLFLCENGLVDPHIWSDLNLWSKSVPYIVKALSNKMPSLSREFHQRGDLLIKEMQDLDLWGRSVFEKIPPNKRYLITGHTAFRYFARRYLATPSERENQNWQSRFEAPEGISPEVQIGFRDISRVSRYILDHELNIVFPEYGLNRAALQKVISSLKGKRDVRFADACLYADSVAPDGASFFDSFRHNVEVIAEGMSQ